MNNITMLSIHLSIRYAVISYSPSIHPSAHILLTYVLYVIMFSSAHQLIYLSVYDNDLCSIDKCGYALAQFDMKYSTTQESNEAMQQVAMMMMMMMRRRRLMI